LTRDVSFFRILKLINRMHISVWERDELKFALTHPTLPRKISDGSRFLVERLFSITRSEQLEIEGWVMTWDFKAQKLPTCLLKHVNDDMAYYSEFFVADYPHRLGCPFMENSPSMRVLNYLLGLVQPLGRNFMLTDRLIRIPLMLF